MAKGLVAYKAEDLALEISADGANWRELIANGYVESEESPDEEVIQAFMNRTIVEIDDRPPQNAAIAMDTPQLSDPTYDFLAARADAEQSLFIRASIPKRMPPLLEGSGTGNTLAIAATTGLGTFVGSPNMAEFSGNEKVVRGIYVKLGAKYAVLRQKGASSTDKPVFEGIEDVTANFTAPAPKGGTDSKVYRPSAAVAIAAGPWEAFYPGWERLAWQAEILTFGALDVTIGGRPQTVLSLKALSRFNQRLVYTV